MNLDPSTNNNNNKTPEEVMAPKIEIKTKQGTESTNKKLNSGKNIKIKTIPCTDGRIFCTLASNNICYYVSYEDKQKLYKYDIENKQTTEYHFDDFTNCISIDYNKSINRVYVTVQRMGVYWFIPGEENNISKLNCFGQQIIFNLKAGMVFNRVQGILKNKTELLYCSNLLKDEKSIHLDIEIERVSQVIFLNNTKIIILDFIQRKLLLMDLLTGSITFETVVHSKGYAITMTISEDKKMIVVGVISPFSYWGLIYVYRVITTPNLQMILCSNGEPYCLGSQNLDIYDLKMAWMPKYNNSLVFLASIYYSEDSDGSIRMFYICKMRDQWINEINDVPKIQKSLYFENISYLDDQFIIGSTNGDYFTIVSFE